MKNLITSLICAKDEEEQIKPISENIEKAILLTENPLDVKDIDFENIDNFISSIETSMIISQKMSEIFGENFLHARSDYEGDFV